MFILCRLVTQPDGKVAKFPLVPATMRGDGWHLPENHVDLETARGLAAACGEGYGVGMVIQPGQVFFDLDDCLTPTGWSTEAKAIVAMLPGAFVEVSASGRGLHVICRSAEPPKSRQISGFGGLYSSGRWVALTWTHARGNWNTDLTTAVAAVSQRYFPA